MEGNEKEGKLDILTWCFLDRSGRDVGAGKEVTGISNHPDDEEEEKYHDGEENSKEWRKGTRKRKTICTHLRVKLDHRSARLRKIKCEVCKV